MASVILVLGPERFLARQAVAGVLERHPDLEVTRHDAAATPVAAILDDVKTPTLFGRPRAVVVDNAGALFDGAALDALAAYAEKPVAGSLLVLSGTGLDGRLKAAKRLKAAADKIRCEPPPDWKVAQWVGSRAREAHGLRMGPEAAEALRACVGEDLGLLDAELTRLKAQIAPRTELSVADVEASTEQHRSPILFEAATALEERDLPAALRAIAGAFTEGVRIKQDIVTEEAGIALILLGNLHRAHTKLTRFHMQQRAGQGESEAARAAGVSPKATTYFLTRARRHRLETLVERHRHFVEADLALKGQAGGSPRQILERLLLALLVPP
ncbi:MAG: DNA polymerase III subunit delta [Planctomycetota bacterium]